MDKETKALNYRLVCRCKFGKPVKLDMFFGNLDEINAELEEMKDTSERFKKFNKKWNKGV